MLNYTDILNDKEIEILKLKTGLGKKFIIKERVLMYAFALLEKFNERIILKGGTAINKIYLDEPRFSEDLDYDSKNAKADTEEIKQFLSDYFKTDLRKMRSIYRIDCFYNGKDGETDKFRVEIAPKKNIENTSSKIARSILFENTFASVKTYTLDALVKQKMDAYFDRIDGKDFYDLYYILQTGKAQKEFLEKRDNLLTRLKHFKHKNIYNTISHYLLKDNRYKYNELIDNFESLLKTLK